jgi:hypothetical protein
MIPAAVRRPAVRRTINSRPPPAAIIGPRAVIADAEIKPAKIVIEAESPSCPWTVVHIEPPCIRAWIVIPAIPWTIVISCTIYNSWPIYKCIEVARCISHIYIVGSYIIDIYVFHCIYRVTWRNKRHCIRAFCGYSPWSGRAVGFKPDSVIHGIVSSSPAQNIR